MPVSLKIVKFDARRFERVRRELDYVSSEAFLRTIPLAEFARALLVYAQFVSPSSSGIGMFRGERTVRQRLTASQMIDRFREGWRVTRETRGNEVSYVLKNRMESFGAQRRWYDLLEFGSSASTWIVRRTFKFFSEDYGWVTFQRGQQIRHAATEGAHVTKKASDFIQENLIPEIKLKISEIIENRLERA